MRTPVTVLAAMSLLLVTSASRADDGSRNYAGLLLGPLIQTKGGSETVFAWGGRIGTAVGSPTWATPSLGLAIVTSSSSATASGVTVDSTGTAILAEILDRHVSETGLYFGGRFGIDLTSADVSAGGGRVSGSGTAFTFSPTVGFEAELSPQVSLDLDASWITFLSHSVTFPTIGAINVPTTQGIGLLGGLSYHW